VPVGEFFGLKSLGIYQSQQQIDALNAKAPGGIYRPGTVAHPGDRYFADITGMASLMLMTEHLSEVHNLSFSVDLTLMPLIKHGISTYIFMVLLETKY
jgi:hypothetical protein